MQLAVTCPVDGPVEVSLEDIDTVVLREPERAEIVFACPECGVGITVVVRIPGFLMAAIEAMSADNDLYVTPLAGLVEFAAQADARKRLSASRRSPTIVKIPKPDDERIDAYCEYFRRQLAGVNDVKDALRELGYTPDEK